MRPRTITMDIGDWPHDIRTRFLAAFRDATPYNYARHSQALGRWLRLARDEHLPPELITPALMAKRCAPLRTETANSMKLALQAVFPEAPVYAKEGRVVRETPRASLQREITRNWHRFTPLWQEAAKPKLHFCSEGLNDGLLVEAWSVDCLQRRLQTLWAFFDFCRSQDLPVEVTAASVKARLNVRQAAFKRGEISLWTVKGEVQRLKHLGQALFPERDWRWLDPLIKMLKKKAALQPTRNDSRVVDLAELKAAAQQCAQVAQQQHTVATNYKKRVSAMKLARSGLAISLLVNSPIRLTSLATLDLQTNFDETFSTLYLKPNETKDRKRDERILAPEVRCQLLDYVETHRAVVAPLGETALFVGDRGKPIGSGYLSQAIGDLTQELFDKRVTPQVVRNIIAGFIVSQAPERAALASVVLNHASVGTTETYRASGTQVIAAQKLREADDYGRKKIAAESKPVGKRHRRKIRTKPVRRGQG